MMNDIPAIGYGTWNRPGEEAYKGTLAALEMGYRHIDGAEGYENEEFVGRAIADVGLPREELWVTTKVAPESFGPGQVRPHVEASLEKLGVGPVDLLLLHYPSINDEYAIEDYMAQFAAVYDAGLCRHIGVSNFTKHYMDRAVALLGDRKILTNQVELHVLMQNRPIGQHCHDMGVRLTAYSPLARGAVAKEHLLETIGAVHGATASQVALAWLLAEGHVVIPSSGHPDRIRENLAAADLQLTAAELKQIEGLERGLRLVDGPWCPAWDVV